ncbi:metallophosphoesterase [Streptomyces sp. NBC_00203]
MVEGSMTQGAGQGPEVVRTATLRDFRVPAYVHETGPYVPETGPYAQSTPPGEGARPAEESAEYSGAAHSSADYPPAEYPSAEYSAEYTPTRRDLPVINRGDTLQVAVDPDAVAAPAPGDGPGPLYVVGDVHGYLDQLVAALQEQGLIDAAGNWSAGTARLWFLGDFTDRGPDGIGVIDLVMRLSAEAAAAGGYCKALMGNHELLLLGAKRFGDTPVNSGAGTATFQAAWLLNGGQKTDMDRLQDHHLQWMARLDAMEQVDGHLLVHSDTTAYLDYGDSIEAVNDTVRETLTRNDADECWDLFRKFTKRFAFRDDGGAEAVRELLGAYGGTRIVHGHSPIPYLLGEVGSEEGEDSAGPVVEGPHLYADGLAIAMDGGVTMAGKLLVRQLPLDS